MSEKLSAREIVDRGFAVGMHQHREEIEGLVELLLDREEPIRNVLEIGTLHGGTAVCWRYLDWEETRVRTMDLPTGKFGGADHGYGDEEKQDARYAKLRTLGITHDDVDSHTARGLQFAEAFAPFDFLFIDGDHSLPGVAADYEMYRRFVRPGGLIAFHDINFTKFHLDAGCYVHVLWENISGCLPVTKGDRQFFNIDQPHQPNGWVFSIGAEWGGIGCLETPK